LQTGCALSAKNTQMLPSSDKEPNLCVYLAYSYATLLKGLAKVKTDAHNPNSPQDDNFIRNMKNFKVIQKTGKEYKYQIQTDGTFRTTESVVDSVGVYFETSKDENPNIQDIYKIVVDIFDNAFVAFMWNATNCYFYNRKNKHQICTFQELPGIISQEGDTYSKIAITNQTVQVIFMKPSNEATATQNEICLKMRKDCEITFNLNTTVPL
jgi:hypothetical protein